MPDVRELLARLNPGTIRYDGAGGGTPSLTNQDIAAALGLVSPGLGRELLESLWWHGAITDKLRGMVAVLIHNEARRRRIAVEDAKTDLRMVEDELEGKNRRTDDQRRQLSQLRAAEEQARSDAWSYSPGTYALIRETVLWELQNPHLCKTCSGHGELMQRKLKVRCDVCGGKGSRPVSNRERASRIARDESTFRENWAAMYDWVFRTLNDAEQAAARELVEALKEGEIKAA